VGQWAEGDFVVREDFGVLRAVETCAVDVGACGSTWKMLGCNVGRKGKWNPVNFRRQNRSMLDTRT
jgi:hypothetical protein